MMKTLSKVQVWIYAQESELYKKILMFHTIPSRGGFWQPVTGGVESGELLQQAAARELYEETSLSATPLFTGQMFEFKSRWGHWVQEFVFVVRLPSVVPVRIDPQEHDSFEWLSQDDALGRTEHEDSHFALQSIVDKKQKSVASAEF